MVNANVMTKDRRINLDRNTNAENENTLLKAFCEDPILFDLVSYCDVRVQSNPFVLKEISVYL